MKTSKKIIAMLMVVSAGLTLGACKNNKNYEGQNRTQQQESARPSKAKALKLMRKTFTSGKIMQTVTVNDTTHKKPVISKIKNQIVFGGQPAIMQIISQNYNSKTKKHQGMMYWVSQNNAYIYNRQKKYYKLGYKAMTGHTYADEIDQIMNNYNITNPDAKLKAAEKIRYQGKIAYIEGRSTDKGVMKETASRILNSAPAALGQRLAFKMIGKLGKCQQMTNKAEFVPDQAGSYSLNKYTETVIIKYGPHALVTVSQTYSNFNLYSQIKLPGLTGQATKMPTVRKKK